MSTLARRLRRWADRIDPDGAPRRTHMSFTFEDRIGVEINMEGRGCPLWYYGMDDYERAHNERSESMSPFASSLPSMISTRTTTRPGALPEEGE